MSVGDIYAHAPYGYINWINTNKVQPNFIFIINKLS